MRLSYLVMLIMFASSFAEGESIGILPTPQSFALKTGSFRFGKSLSIKIGNKKSYALVYLKTMLTPLGTALDLTSNNAAHTRLSFITDRGMAKEAYTLDVSPNEIQIKAFGDAGFFYALQSLSQLIQVEQALVPCVSITDEPRYKLRSFLLDSGRQFQKVSTIKKYLDMMAMLKMNTFHWHLTEGMGWRLEIKKYPKLTSIGAFISDGKEQKGFYTQQDVKEIIKYAAARNITVMPEIDMPGHAEAALISYPQYSCFGDTTRLKANSGFTKNLFCPGKPQTMEFLKNVLKEVCELFPSTYIHVGGDEAPKGNWDTCPDCQALIKNKGLKNSGNLQLYFSAQIADYLKSKGKKAVFWEDVLYETGYTLPDNVVIHWWNWRSHKDTGMTESLNRGHEVIAGTNYYTYLNFPVTPWSGYKESRTFDIKDVYEKNPSAYKDINPLVLGMSAALWCDNIVTESMIDQRLFPRIFALSEQMWHKGDALSFNAFYKVVREKKARFEKMGYKYGPGLRSEVPAAYQWD